MSSFNSCQFIQIIYNVNIYLLYTVFLILQIISTLTIRPLLHSDKGHYYCSTKDGKYSEKARLLVSGKKTCALDYVYKKKNLGIIIHCKELYIP